MCLLCSQLLSPSHCLGHYLAQSSLNGKVWQNRVTVPSGLSGPYFHLLLWCRPLPSSQVQFITSNLLQVGSTKARLVRSVCKVQK